jgi:hypothetical protein
MASSVLSVSAVAGAPRIVAEQAEVCAGDEVFALYISGTSFGAWLEFTRQRGNVNANIHSTGVDEMRASASIRRMGPPVHQRAAILSKRSDT